MKTIERVKQYIDFKGYSNSFFEKENSLSNGYIATQLKRNADLGEGVLNKIINNCLDINPLWLLTGKGNMLQTKVNSILSTVLSDRKTKDAIYDFQRVPLFNLEATMGLVPLVDGNGVDEEKIIDYITIPSMPSCDGAIYASGDSMYPLLKSGDMIAYKRIAVERSQIFFGEMYKILLQG